MRKFLLAASAAISALNAAPALAAASEGCSTEAVQAMAPPGTTVAMAVREVFADRDEVYSDENWGCRVSGWVTNQNPGPNRVMFNLTLPDNFNGRYLYLGVGGAAGKIPNMPQRLLAQGYALAGSDGGSGAKSIADFSFMSDPARLTDFMWRGVQSSAEATQAIARAYYAARKSGAISAVVRAAGRWGWAMRAVSAGRISTAFWSAQPRFRPRCSIPMFSASPRICRTSPKAGFRQP